MTEAGSTPQETRIGEIVLRAAALDPAERTAYFAKLAAAEPELLAAARRRLEEAARLPTSFLALPAGGLLDDLTAAGDGPATAALHQDEPPPLRPEERYRLEDLLGEGGMAKVYRAHDAQLGRDVAIKLLDHPDPATRRRLLLEARAQARVRHDNVLEVYETGELEGTPYIAMRYVAGRTLAEACDGLALEGKVRLLAEVAEGLHAAHREGLLHRDVKPANVLVEETPDGALKPYVADFGIAVLGAADATDDMAGTPYYMAPERLRPGAAADRRSDVYSLGVTMYRLFTGELPFAATELGEALRQIRDLPPPPPRQRAPELPAEVEAIVQKCMAKEPEERYPSARAVAEDLRRYLDGRVVEAHAATLIYRWTKFALRHRTLLAVGGGATVILLAALIVFTVLTSRARDLAEARRLQAEDLLTFMVSDLRPQVATVSKLEVLDEVDAKALEYFASVPAEELSQEELGRRSRVLYQIGDVRMRQGDLDAAMNAFEQSRDLAENLHRRDPDRPEWLFELGQCHFWVGYVHFNRGDLDGALAEFEAYLDIGRRLTAADPANLDWRMELAYGHDNVGQVLAARGEPEKALEHFSRHREILGELVAAEPDRTDRAEELANSHLLVGQTRETLGDLGGALDSFRSGLEILRRLAAGDPANHRWQLRLGTACSYAGSAFEQRGELDRAEAHFAEQLAILSGLVESDPDNAQWRGFRAVAGLNLARVLGVRGDPGRQLAHAASALEIVEDLIARDPSDFHWQRNSALLRLQLAAARRALGELERARQEAAAARDLLASLAAERPGDPTTARSLCRAHLLLGRVLHELGRPREARSEWSRAHRALLPFADDRSGAQLAILARTLIRLERAPEADEIVTELRRRGYVDPDLERLLAQ